MQHLKRWTTTVIIEHNKCYLDEEVLQVATSHVKKEEDDFWNSEYWNKKNLSMSEKNI